MLETRVKKTFSTNLNQLLQENQYNMKKDNEDVIIIIESDD